MINVKQFRYGSDNLAYLIYNGKAAMAIDGGAWRDILGYCDENNLALVYVTNTHIHGDHTPGNANLLRRTGAKYLDSEVLEDKESIRLVDDTVVVMRTPGHSRDSVCFYTGSALISGDTLFNGTIGNCFTGDLKGFYLSIKRIMELPPETVIYAGHDYMHDALAFAEHLEPANPEITLYRKNYNYKHVYSILSDELKVNPYLRFNEPSIKKTLMERGLAHETEWDRWKSLMSVT